MASWKEWRRWGSFVYVDYPDCAVMDVQLHGRNITDADLPSLLRHMTERLSAGEGWMGYQLDLSHNAGITDFGISIYLAPFLRKWPHCRVLKLSETSAGDSSLKALVEWVCQGQVVELNLSELGGTLSNDMVWNFLQKLKDRRRLPYWHPCANSSLWLRLDHNDIESIDLLADKGQTLAYLQVWEKAAKGWTVRSQQKPLPARPSVEVALFPASHAKERHGEIKADMRKQLLSMLHVSGEARAEGTIRAPMVFTEDEYRLWQMESREDAENGADDRNEETFGGEAIAAGWSFEENLAANQRLAKRGSGWSQEATATTLELEAKVPVPEPIPEPPAAIQPSLSDAKQQVEAEC